jgi:hypothetical protein
MISEIPIRSVRMVFFGGAPQPPCMAASFGLARSCKGAGGRAVRSYGLLPSLTRNLTIG